MKTFMKKRIKRTLSASFLSLSMLASVFTLTGCHGSQGLEPFAVPTEFNESQHYEITFWAKNDTNKTQTEIYKKAIADFEKLYPNIDVNLRLYTDYGKIYNDVITNISTGTTPNVCITYPDHIATYISGSNIVVPLDELMTDEMYGLGGSEIKFDSPKKDEIIEKFLNECIVSDSVYAIPYMRSTEVCYVNKTYVEKLGYELPKTLTWDFVWKVSEAATAKNSEGKYKVNGQDVMIPFIYKSTDNMMIQMVNQMGTGYSDDQGNIYLFNDDTKKLLIDISEHAKTGAFSTFKISSYPANFLNAGQCIFAIDSTAGSTWMGTDAPLIDISKDALVDFETVVYPIPQYDTSNPSMISQGPSVCIFNKADSGEVLASWIFAQYLLTNEIQTSYAMTEGYVPVTTKAQESTEYQNYLKASGEDNELHYKVKIDATKILLNNMDNTFVTPVFNGSTSLRNASGQLIEEVVKTARRGQKVDEETVEKTYEEMKSLYRLDSTGAVHAGMKEDLGEMPDASGVLIAILVLVWAGIITYVVISGIKRKKNSK